MTLWNRKTARRALMSLLLAGAALTTASAQEGPRPYLSLQAEQAQSASLGTALAAIRSGNFALAESYRTSLPDPIARKIVQWAIIDSDGAHIYGFAALDAARRDLWGWPREARRQIAAEKQIIISGLSSAQIIDWFTGAPPVSVDGAIALIGAYEREGRASEAQTLARSWWRDQAFERIDQERFYSAFSRYLTPDDHKTRLNTLLLGAQGPATQAMLGYVDADTRNVAEAAMALRSGSSRATTLYEAARAAHPRHPVLAYERARTLRRANMDTLGYGLLTDFPAAPASKTAINNLWVERLSYFRSALKNRNYNAAYAAMNGAGFPNGEKKAEAEFFAGWIALTRLNRPDLALSHFEGIREAGTTPITQGRAYYWIGRAHEARGDAAQAQAAYQAGGQFIYAFYGQLAAEKAGIKTISIGKDPVPTAEDRARFENRDLVKAAKLLGQAYERNLFNALVLALDDNLPNAGEMALLHDLTTTYTSPDVSMRVARVAMQRGFYLPERAYPLRAIPPVRAPEAAFVLGITRQESGFDPNVRSHANARGLMQLIPPTARAVARRMSLSYSDARLYEPEFNMQLGAYHLGELVDRFGGSYIMAAAGYNAGPGRPAQWAGDCGDPRGNSADPLWFIECAPFTETRNYMMRVMENTQVYRARLNGGTAALSPSADLQRGAAIAYVPDTSDTGNTSTPDGPINYLDLRN